MASGTALMFMSLSAVGCDLKCGHVLVFTCPGVKKCLAPGTSVYIALYIIFMESVLYYGYIYTVT